MPAIVVTTSASNHSPINLSILKDDRYPYSARAILLYLADHLPTIIRVTTKEIEIKCGMTHPTVVQSMQRLAKLGLIDRHAVMHPKFANKTRLEYSLSDLYAADLCRVQNSDSQSPAAAQ